MQCNDLLYLKNMGIARSKFGILDPKRYFNVIGCYDWLKESGRND